MLGYSDQHFLYCSRFLLKGGRVSAEVVTVGPAFSLRRDADCHLFISESHHLSKCTQRPFKEAGGRKMTGTGASVKHDHLLHLQACKMESSHRHLVEAVAEGLEVVLEG